MGQEMSDESNPIPSMLYFIFLIDINFYDYFQKLKRMNTLITSNNIMSKILVKKYKYIYGLPWTRCSSQFVSMSYVSLQALQRMNTGERPHRHL